jgi:hypothetical protein
MTCSRLTLLLALLAFPMRGMAAEPSEAKAATDAGVASVRVVRHEPARPSLLLPLYASLGGLQACDGYFTLSGVRSGASESNPLMAGAARNPAVFWTLKGSATFASIYFSERLWRRHHRAEAVAVMIVSNGIMAAVAARNASVLSRR